MLERNVKGKSRGGKIVVKGVSKIDVLDNGYVRLVDVMGGDLRTVNAARVSYDKQSDEMSDKDIKLIKFLAREDHMSPFRHSMISFEVYAPLMIARQWWKYVVGSDHVMDAWNESSRRYITEESMFYIPSPNEWRSKPENSKQGSGENLAEQVGESLTEELIKHVEHSEYLYNEAMKIGLAPEQARLFLPAYGMYVRWYWTASLESVVHLIKQRTASDAQFEFREYANAVKDLITPHFQYSIEELLKK